MFSLRSLCVLSPFTLRSLAVLSPFSLRSLSVLSPFTLRSLSIHSPFTLHSLSVFSRRSLSPGHHFHHLGTALEIIDHDKDEDERILQEKPWWLLVKPHVSSVMAENARKSFDMWADDYMYDQQQAQERKNSMAAGRGRRGEVGESSNIQLSRRSISQVTDEELER